MKKEKIIMMIIAIIGIISMFLIWGKDSNKVTLDEVRLKDNEVSKKQFAMYIRESKNEDYKEYTNEDNLFPVGYKLDLEQSGCVDGNGEKVTAEGIISQTSDNKITLKSNKTVYCYLYFEKNSFNGTGKELAQSESKGLIATPDKGDLAYRYVGTYDDNPENYICFGSDNCAKGENKENFQYRIIGVDTSGRLKLIKDTAISTSAQWHNKYSSSDCSSGQCTWEKSTMYQYLNTDISGFYANSNNTYVPTEGNWKEKIDDTNWKIGDSNGDKATTGDAIWAWESASTATTPSKIGLMYLSDYYYSLDGTGTKNCRQLSDYPTCKTSWLHLTNNDSSQKIGEWTMSRYGLLGSNYNAWSVDSSGQSGRHLLDTVYSVRPVFYLTAETTISSGTGTLEDPFIIKL